MHPTRSAYVTIEGETIGYFGELLPSISEKLGIDKKAYVGEIYYDELKKYFDDKIAVKPVSKYPSVERDLAVTVDDNVPSGDISDTIYACGGETLENVELFDVYKGDQVAKGKKSIAFNLLFNAGDRTLSVEEIDEAVKVILKNLKDKFGAELR